MLLVQPIDTSAQSLPSPNQLKKRVIIKVSISVTRVAQIHNLPPSFSSLPLSLSTFYFSSSLLFLSLSSSSSHNLNLFFTNPPFLPLLPFISTTLYFFFAHTAQEVDTG